MTSTTVYAVIGGVVRGGNLERMATISYYGAALVSAIIICLLATIVVLLTVRR